MSQEGEDGRNGVLRRNGGSGVSWGTLRTPQVIGSVSGQWGAYSVLISKRLISDIQLLVAYLTKAWEVVPHLWAGNTNANLVPHNGW